jgi:hypothetical protein
VLQAISRSSSLPINSKKWPEEQESDGKLSSRPVYSDPGSKAGELSFFRHNLLPPCQVRSELKKSLEEPEAEDEDDTKRRAKERRRKEAEEKAMNIRTSVAKSVFQWLVKPPRNQKLNEMFLPGRTSFMFDLVRKGRGVLGLLRVLDLGA